VVAAGDAVRRPMTRIQRQSVCELCFGSQHPVGLCISFAQLQKYRADDTSGDCHDSISWNQAWTDTDRVQFFQLGAITAAPNKSPAEGREGRNVVVWEKVKAPTQ
jgi:hypothetical protein